MGRFSLTRRRVSAVVLAIVAAAGAWLLLAGDDDAPEPVESPPRTAATGTGASGAPAGLSTEELVDQLLLVGFDGSEPKPGVLRELRGHQLGGVLVGASNWKGKGPGRKLIDALRAAGAKGGRIEPLIATDQEGGTYRSLTDLPPSEREIEIGDRGSREVAKRWGKDGAEALEEVGIDLNLAPVADVATLDSPIADRAFSDDPSVAAEMTAAAVDGCKAAGVACAVSHFPGLGAASQDTNAGPAFVGLDPATLRGRDLVPFVAAFEAGAPAVVVSHGLYSAYDSVTPASLLPAITTDLLRGELRFEGVAISDDIGAGAIGAVMTPAEAAVEAVAAGIDLIQVADPRNVAEVRRALLGAVEDGTLGEERLREAAGRVMALKRELAAARRKGDGGGKKGGGSKARGGPRKRGRG